MSHIHGESVRKSRSNLNKNRTNYQERRKGDIFWLYHTKLTLDYLHSLQLSVPEAPNVLMQIGCYISKRSWIASQCIECCFYHSVPNFETKNNCVLCLAFNKLRWWILTFLSTVILFLSCIEITCSSSNSLFSSIKQVHDDDPLCKRITILLHFNSRR